MVVFEDDGFVTEVIDALPPANGVAEVVAEDGGQCHVNPNLLRHLGAAGVLTCWFA